MKQSILDQLLQDRQALRPVVLATELGSGNQVLLYPREARQSSVPVPEDLLNAARETLRLDRGTTIEIDGGRWFLNAFNPPLRMIIVGAVHITQTLAPMATLAGFAVSVVDPRRAFATEARFPDVTLHTEWPDEALAALAPDSRTAIVTLTHDPKLDDPALTASLRSDAFYIGALGSNKTHAARLARLRENGFQDEELARIHGPVGLSIGARSPAEIAVSVLAEVIRSLRQGPGS